MTGSPVATYLHPDEFARVFEIFQPLWRGAVDSVESDSRAVRTDGTEVWLHWSATSVRNAAGRISYFLAMYEDTDAEHAANEAAAAHLAGLERLNRLKSEYPDIDLHHTVLDQIFPKVVSLFDDDSFVPVFGKPFDAMSADDRNYVKQLMRRLFMGRETRELLDGFGDFLNRPFVLDRGSFSYADVAPQLAFRRAVHQKWRETMDQLSTVSSTSAG